MALNGFGELIGLGTRTGMPVIFIGGLTEISGAIATANGNSNALATNR